MAGALCKGPLRMSLAAIGAGMALLVQGSGGQVLAIGFSAAVGLLLLGTSAPNLTTSPAGLPRPSGLICLVLFAVLLAAAPFLARLGTLGAVVSSFYTAGGFVFGGGHVVAPLLDAAVVETGFVSRDVFLQGYGLAQAMPGPLFSFAAYLGQTIGGLLGAILATIAIFLPGLLLMAGMLPIWRLLSDNSRLRGAVAGVNAAVVGLLAAALYDPVFVGSVRGLADLATGIAGFFLLHVMKAPPIAVVAACALAGVGLSSL
jgi:chromate transporter